MDDFDPDAYLANSPEPATGSGDGFDPDAYLRDFNPDEYLGTKPAAEGPITSNIRAAAHGIIPAAGAVVGGALVGGAAGSVGGPLGALAGGIAGGIAGGFAGDVVQDKLQENVPAIDDRAQMQADREAYPISTAVSGMVPFAGNPGKLAGSLVQRGANAAMLGGIDVAQQAYQKGSVDPAQALAVAGFGAAFPNGNRLTRAAHDRVTGQVNKYIPGRPGKTETNPDAAQAHDDVGDNSVETAVGDSVLAESPPGDTQSTVGTPQENRPTNSRGEVATGEADASYAKTTPPSEGGGMSSGQIAPDIQSALSADQQTPAVPAAAPQQRPLGMPAQNFRAPEERPAEAPRPVPEPVVDAGFPNVGEPVAVGENEATPMPEGTPERAQAAIKRSRAAQEKPVTATVSDIPMEKSPEVMRELSKAGKTKQEIMDMSPEQAHAFLATLTPPKFEGRSAMPTEAQAEAGNYKKVRAQDFGKPMALETHAGTDREGTAPDGTKWKVKSPYDYGYFGKTVSTDTTPTKKEGIDWAMPPEGSPKRGNKFFIIDQKHADTGKYDEPKVFQYYKDIDAAADDFNKGFSDNKGPDRFHDITEVTRGELSAWLAKHSTRPPKGPFKTPIPKAAKPLREREGVKAAAEKLKAKGNIEGAEKLLTAPDEALAGRVENLRARKYGVKGGYPVEGLTNEIGEPVTAKDKKTAAERSADHKQVKDFFKGSAPKPNESPGDTYDRVTGNPYVGRKKGVWVPAHMPREWLYAAAARELSRRKIGVEKFREIEKRLRGSEEDVNAYRSERRTDADIANSRRTGDEAVANAEAEAARTGRNDEEDKMLENIGRQRGDFDVPHEEAEEMVKPRPIKKASDIKDRTPKQIDVSESKLAETPPKAKPIAKMTLKDFEAETKKPEPAPVKTEKVKGEHTPEELAKASIKSKLSAEDMQKYIDASNRAANRKGLTDDEIHRMDIGRDFLADEKGAVGGAANAARGVATRKWLANKISKLLGTGPVRSYRALDIKPGTNRVVNDMFDRMHVVNNIEEMAKNETQRKAELIERDADRAALERIYKAREADSAHLSLPGKLPGKTNVESLSPADTKVWDTHIKPLLEDTDVFKDTIRKLDPKRMGPDVEHYIARLTKGDTTEYDLLRKSNDPTAAGPYGMAINAGMARERAFTVLERKADGRRFVVFNKDPGKGFTLWDNQKGTHIKDPSYEFEANQPYTVTGKNGNKVDYTMRHATADEIERSGAKFDTGTGNPIPAKYHQNAGLSALMAHAKLGEMARNLTELARIKTSKDFQDRMTRNKEDADKRGYITTHHPNFEGDYLDPRLAHLLDDFSKPGFDTPEGLRSLNQGVTKLLFWMPVAHIANVGTHWFVGRGADWLSVPGYHRLAVTVPKAIRLVLNGKSVTRDRLMEQGASFISPSVRNRHMMETVAKALGEEIERNPSKYGPIADAFRVPLDKLNRAIYDNSSRVMWAASDMFLAQRTLELEMKGRSAEQAVKQAERDIPNYRVPPQLFTGDKAGRKAALGRFFSQVLQDPAVSSFGRYHYGVFNSYANIFKDGFGKNSTPAERLDAAGKLMALGILGLVVYPMLDKAAKMVTGNEDASQQRRGPLAIPSHLIGAAQGKEDVASAVRSTITIPPFWSTVIEGMFNHDWRGKNIVEPGDVAAGFKGNAYRGGKAAVQLGEHFARGLISPLGTLSTAEAKEDEPGPKGLAKAVGGAVRDQALDVKDPSRNARRYMMKQDIINDRNARQREKHGGAGVLENAYIKAFRPSQ